MKKKLSIVLIMALMVLTLGACSSETSKTEDVKGETASASGSEESQEAKEIELTVIDYFVPGEGISLAFDKAYDEFITENPNVTVEREIIANSDLKTKVQTLAAASQLPDIYLIKGQMASTFVENGKVYPIDEYLDANTEWKDNFKEGVFSNFQFNGQTYGVPFQVTNSLAFYNTDLFEQAGIEGFPETWDELLTAIDKLKAIDVVPIALGNKDKWPAESIIFSTLGNRFTGDEWYQSIRDNSGAKFTDAQFVNALAAFAELGAVGGFNPDVNSTDNAQQRQMYMTGQAAIIFDGSWAINELEANAPEDILNATEIGAIPAVDGGLGDQEAITGGAGWAYAINADIDPEKLDAAIAYITAITDADYATTAEAQGLITAQYPSVESDDSDKVLTTKFKAFVKDRFYIPVYDHQLESGVIEEMNTGLQELLQGSITAEELAARIEKEFE